METIVSVDTRVDTGTMDTKFSLLSRGKVIAGYPAILRPGATLAASK